MSRNARQSRRPPEVDTKGLPERKLLEARLMVLDAQIRNFGRIRDRLSAAGADGNAHYQKIQAQRGELSAALMKASPGVPAPPTGGVSPPFQHPGEPLLALPIAPARFDRDMGVFGFGTSGYVQIGPASEGTNVVAHGKHPSTGELATIPGSYPGAVDYRGVLSVGPELLQPDQFDQLDWSPNYVWLRSWKYLIPFPPPTVESRLTYRFEVYARNSIFFEGGEATAMAFVSVGETGNLTTGSNVAANVDAGWPLVADLTQSADLYNGHYGIVDGATTVQRSFLVPANRVPGVAVVVGAVGALSMMTRVRFTFAEYCTIGVGTPGMGSRIAYSYEPVLAAHL